MLSRDEWRPTTLHVPSLRQVFLLLGPRDHASAQGEVLLLQRGGLPEWRAASGAGAVSRASRASRDRSARRRKPASGQLRRRVSAAPDALAAAIRKGNTRAVETLLDADPALVNARRPDGSSFVLYAVYCGHARLVDVFRERGRAIDLFEATAAGDAPAARAFLAADPGAAKAFSPDGFPVLGLAVFFGHATLAELVPCRRRRPQRRVDERHARRAASFGHVAGRRRDGPEAARKGRRPGRETAKRLDGAPQRRGAGKPRGGPPPPLERGGPLGPDRRRQDGRRPRGRARARRARRIAPRLDLCAVCPDEGFPREPAPQGTERNNFISHICFHRKALVRYARPYISRLLFVRVVIRCLSASPQRLPPRSPATLPADRARAAR